MEGKLEDNVAEAEVKKGTAFSNFGGGTVSSIERREDMKIVNWCSTNGFHKFHPLYSWYNEIYLVRLSEGKPVVEQLGGEIIGYWDCNKKIKRAYIKNDKLVLEGEVDLLPEGRKSFICECEFDSLEFKVLKSDWIYKRDKLSWPNEIVYGPVDSRRLGKSLGINLSSLVRKTCSFDCVYCSGGPTKEKKLIVDPRFALSLEYIQEEIQRGFEYHKREETEIDYISVVGATEPTIHPNFSEFVDSLFSLLRRYFPDKQTAVFTNCTNLGEEKIRSAFQLFHRKFFKLDAGDEETLQRINRPVEGVSLKNIVKNLTKLKDIELSVGIVDSNDGNYRSIKSAPFIDILKQIKPIKIYVYDMDRPVPIEHGLKMMRTSEERLIELADYLSGNTGIETIVLRAKNSRGIHELTKSLYSHQHREFLA